MEQNVEIRKIDSKKDISRFIKFPWKIYRGKTRYDNWVPPLIIDKKSQFNRKKNPFFKHADMQLFLAYRGSEIVGRIAAIIDYDYVEYQKDESGFFGYFESFNDQLITDALMKAAADWIKEKGYSNILGPMSPSTGTSLGTLIDSFDIPPIIEMDYNPDYYPLLLEGTGLTKAKDLFSYNIDTTLRLSEKMKRVSELVMKRHKVTVRTINMKDYDNEVELLRNIYNAAWKNNWGFVPWRKEDFDHLAVDIKMIINEKLVLIVEVEGEAVGFTIPFPNVNQIFIKMNGRLFPTGIFKLLAGIKKIDILRVAIFGVHEKHHNKGLDAVIIKEIYERGEALGIKGAELSWILENNHALNNLLTSWGAKHYRTYRVYGKSF